MNNEKEGIIFTLLRVISNDLKVLESRESSDDRLTFILDEYQSFLESGSSLRELDDEMSFKEIKEELSTLPLKEQLEFAGRWDIRFGPLSKVKEANERKMVYVKYLFIFSLAVITFLVTTLVLYGVIYQALDPRENLNSLITFLSNIFGFLLPPQPY